VKPAARQPGVPLVDQDHHVWGEAWHMRDEFAFLRGLSSWRPHESVPDRAQLLRGYLKGLSLRRRWTGLEREALECEAKVLLRELESRTRKSA